MMIYCFFQKIFFLFFFFANYYDQQDIPYFLPNRPNFRTLILDLIFFGSAYWLISKIIINNKQKTIIFRARNWPWLIWQFGLLTGKYGNSSEGMNSSSGSGHLCGGLWLIELRVMCARFPHAVHGFV